MEDVAHVVEGAGRQPPHRDGAGQPVDDAGTVGGSKLTCELYKEASCIMSFLEHNVLKSRLSR